jgi:hypothetical protein
MRLTHRTTDRNTEPAGLPSRWASMCVYAAVLLVGPFPAAADDETDPVPAAAVEELRERMPWYDGEQDRVRPREATLPKEPPQPSDWEGTFAEEEVRDRPRRESTPGQASNPAGLLSYMLWAVGIVLGLVLIFVLIRLAVAAYRNPREKKTAPSFDDLAKIEELPFAVKRPKGDFLSEARRLYNEGQYGEAMLYFYSYLLLQLDRRQLIHLDRGKTNRQYLRELRSARALRRVVEPSMIAFEEVFFGRHELTRGQCDRCFDQLPEFQQLVEQAA